MRFTAGQGFLPPNDGEVSAVRFFLDRLNGDDGHVLTNVFVPDGNGRFCETDILIINQHGVYDVEVKNWVGPLIAGDSVWMTSGGERPNPSVQAKRQSRMLHGYLQENGLGWVRTRGLVLLVRGLSNVTYPKFYKYKAFEFEEDDKLITAIRQPDAYFGTRTARRLNAAEMEAVFQCLSPHPNQPRPLQIAGFQVTGQRRGHPYYVELAAYDVEIPQRRVRIKAYRLGQAISVGQIARAVERFKRELWALLEADGHENLVRPIQFTRDMRSDDGYFLILEDTGLSTLVEALRAGPLPAERRRVMLRDTAAALAFCHQKGFIHRNLSPESVYLTATGRARVGDFDMVRLPAFGTITSGRARLAAGRHVAPEQQRDVHDVDARADVFALGALWYDMLFAPAAALPLQRAHIDDAPLDAPAKGLLRRLLAEDQEERPATMVAVLSELDALSGV